MSYSGLVSYVRISPNRTSPRYRSIKNIIVHHMAGNLSVETCGNVFAPSSRQASSNYGIGSDGRIACYVQEEDRAWTTGNQIDHDSITIEVADDVIGGSWHSSAAAMQSLVKLCADICRRHGFRLNYTGGKSGNLLMHKWYQATDCPGAYLESQFPWIAQETNKLIDDPNYSVPSPVGGITITTPTVPGVLSVDGSCGPDTVKKWQAAMGTTVDGIVSGQLVPDCKTYWRPNLYTGCVTYGGYGSQLIRAVQARLGLTQDGLLGPATIKAIQKHYGLAQDASFGPATVRALQTALNKGTFNIWAAEWPPYYII